MFDNVYISILSVCGILAIVTLLLMLIVGFFQAIGDVFNIERLYNICEKILSVLLGVFLFGLFVVCVDGLVAILHILYCAFVNGSL